MYKKNKYVLTYSIKALQMYIKTYFERARFCWHVLDMLFTKYRRMFCYILCNDAFEVDI